MNKPLVQKQLKTNKNVSGKYDQKILDHVSAADALKTTSKRVT